MELKVNGTATEIEEGTTLATLLARYEIAPDATGVAVAVNEAVITRREWDTCELHAGDRVEIIHAVQGG